MAPAGPPSDPPDRPDRPGDRPADDWDWGDDWDAPARPEAGSGDAHDERSQDAVEEDGAGSPDARARAAGAPRGRRDAPGEAADDAPRAADDAERHDDATAAEGADDGAAPRSPRTPSPAVLAGVARRRRAVAAGAAAVLVLAVVGAVALAGGDDGGDDGPRASTTPAGGALRELTGVAARASSDEAERAAAVAKYARIGRPVYCGAGRKPWVALTFDDGPGPLSGRWIAMMSKADAPMTLFRIGRNVPGNEEYVRVQRNLGWDSGSHTQNHPPLATLSAKDQRREIEHGDDASHRALGRPPVLFRPPYESHDQNTDRIVRSRDMVEVLWNVDTQDSLGATSADEIVASAKKGMKPGSIILMHEVKPNTLQAMPRILAALRAKGLKPVTVSRMLASDGPSEAQLRKGYDGCAVDVTPGKASS